MISLRIVIKCIVMFVLVNTFRMSNRPFVATLSIHSSPAILFLSSSNGSATPLVLRPVLTLKSFNVTPIDTGQKNDRRFDADRLNQQAQMLRPKYTDQPLSSYDQVMSLQTPNNLNPLMNRWMRNGSTGQRFQMLLRSFPRPTISNPFRSFRYPADSSSITDSFTKPTTYETLDHTNANLHSLLARPAVEPEFGTLSHLLHRFPSSLESIPMELAEQPTLASFGDTKSSPGLEIHSESDFVDHSHGSIDTFFDPIIPTEFDRLNTHLRHHHRSPSPSSDSVDIFSAKSLYPFVTYDLDEFGVPMLKSTRHPPRSTRKSKRRRGNLDRLMVKGRARPESSSIQIDGPVAFEEPEDLQVNDAKDSDERLTTNSNSESKKVKPIRPNKGNNSSNLDNEALLKLLDQKLSSAELLSLLVNKLNSNPKEQSIVLQTLTTPQHSFQQSASYESENFFLQRAKPNEDRVASIANGERSMNEFEQFNYEKDYSYFEMPKCASALNSTYCLQDEHYPNDMIRDDIQLNRNQIRSMFGVWLNKLDMVDSPHNLVDHLSDNQDEQYDWNHYFVMDRASNRNLRPTSEATGSDNGHDLPESERNRIRLRTDYFRKGGYICSSVVTYSNLKRAKNLDKQWKFIINLEEKVLGQSFRQTVRLEQCIYPDVSCNYLSSSFNSHCIQKYNYQQLLSWTKDLGVHLDIYRLPIACSCHFRKTITTKS